MAAKIKVLLLISFLIISLFSCSDDQRAIKNITVAKPTYYVKYFKGKVITSRNNYKYIDTRFIKEIRGSSYEINQMLKAVDREKGTYYKVYYYNLPRIIARYEFFKRGILKAYATYYYSNIGTAIDGKLYKINYYDARHDLIAYDIVNYNKSIKPTSITRFRMPGKRLSQIF